MRGYLFNFFYWWYLVRGEQEVLSFTKRVIFLLEYTNTLTMARNLTVPLFQDNTGSGKAFAFILRGIWVWFGGMASLVMAIPNLFKMLFHFLLPIMCLFGISLNLLNLLS